MSAGFIVGLGMWAVDGHIMLHDIVSSCQPAATSEIVKHA